MRACVCECSYVPELFFLFFFVGFIIYLFIYLVFLIAFSNALCKKIPTPRLRSIHVPVNAELGLVNFIMWMSNERSLGHVSQFSGVNLGF